MTSLKRISFKSLALSLFIIILINSAFSASAASINVNPVGIEPYEERFELDYKNETAKTAVVTRYTAGKSVTTAVFPDVIDGYTITGLELRESSFPGITSVIIPPHVKTIQSLYIFPNVTDISLPDGLVQIRSAAFVGLSLLESIDLPPTVNQILSGAFTSSGITSLTIPPLVTVIEPSLFNKCHNLRSVSIHNNVTRIYPTAFAQCTSLHEIMIPRNVRTIDDTAFDGSGLTTIYGYKCSKAEEFAQRHGYNFVVLPETVATGVNGDCSWQYSNGELTVSGQGTLADFQEIDMPWGEIPRDEISSVIIEDGVTGIGKCCFSDCINLESVTIADSVERIGDLAFSNCQKLSSITFPKNLTTLEGRTFMKCNSLHEATISRTVTNIGTPFNKNYVNAIYGYSGSAAQYYADRYGINFVELPETITPEEYNGHYYQLFTDAVNWKTAKEICEARGGHLVTVSDSGEQAFIERMSLLMNYNGKAPWLGGYRNPDDLNEWKWVTGEEWSFTAWNGGQPSYIRETALALCENQIGVIVSQNWNDDDETRSRFYICEWENQKDISNSCPTGTTAFKTNRYKIYTDAVNWQTAKRNCELLGGHLATVSDFEEQSFIAGLNTSNSELWLGGYRNPENPDEWLWADGEPWQFTSWNSGEPNNTEENALSINPANWNDAFGYLKRGYICEWEFSAVGDVNRDGSADIRDVTAIQRYLSEIEHLSPDRVLLSDVNNDGNIDIDDATQLQKIIALISDDD